MGGDLPVFQRFVKFLQGLWARLSWTGGAHFLSGGPGLPPPLPHSFSPPALFVAGGFHFFYQAERRFFMSDLQSLFTDCLNETLIRVILSNPSSKDGVIKICARPMLKNKSLLFQIEEYTKTQVFHKNLTAGDAGS